MAKIEENVCKLREQIRYFCIIYTLSWDNIIGIMTWLWAGRSTRSKGFFFLLESVQAGYGAHPASYAVGTTGDVKLAAHLNLVFRLTFRVQGT